MIEMGIIADDLTGASDSGVQLARRGLISFVLFHLGEEEKDIKADVIVADTDSRALPAEEAYDKVKITAKSFVKLGSQLMFKKLDSTLRGNLGAEIDAVMDANSYELAIIAPAFPQLGRTTLNGRHYLNGVPIDQTEIANDPKAPVHESDIIALLNKQSKRQAGLIERTVLLQGKQEVWNALGDFWEKSISLVVFDAEEDDDLKKIVNYVSDSPYHVLWVGSAGLAEYMPILLKKKPKKKEMVYIEPTGQQVMLISGSRSEVTKKQVQAFANQPTVESIILDPNRVGQSGTRSEEIKKCINEINAALNKKRDVVFYVGTPSNKGTSSNEGTLSINNDGNNELGQLATLIANALGTVTAQVLEQRSLQGIILTGGDTAKSVCKHLGVSGIELIDEVEKGIPLSRMVGYKNLLTVTKAGAFGNETSLIHAMNVMKGD